MATMRVRSLSLLVALEFGEVYRIEPGEPGSGYLCMDGSICTAGGRKVHGMMEGMDALTGGVVHRGPGRNG